MPRSVRSKSHRGTELLDQLAEVLPNLYNFDKENDFDFAAIITLLNKYWHELKNNIDRDEVKFRVEFIRILNRMVILYREINKPITYGVTIIICHIEYSYLNDEEAQLVHNITGIHIDRAASILGAKSTAAGRIAAAPQCALQDERPDRADQVSRPTRNQTLRAMLGRLSRDHGAHAITPKIASASSKSSSPSPFAPPKPTAASKP